MGMPSKNTVIAAISNLSTAYNLVVINVAHILVQNQYCDGDNCQEAVSVASTACLVGAILGQLCMGYVGDCLGRSRALQLTMALSIFGAMASAFAVPLDPRRPHSVFYALALARLVLGIGVGGVYPLSATIAAESASSAASRGFTASIVFSMQGVGNLTVPLVALALVAACGNPPPLSEGGPEALGLSWRLALGLGALPGLLLAPFKARETKATASGARPLSSMDGAQASVDGGGGGACAAATNGDDRRYSQRQTHDGSDGVGGGAANMVAVQEGPLDDAAGRATGDAPSSAAFSDAPTGLITVLRMRRYWGKLLGCAGGWFLFDVSFYGNQLFQATVLDDIFGAAANHSARKVDNPPHHQPPMPVAGGVNDNVAIQMLIIAAIGLPGYYVAVGLMERLGRRLMQLQGFLFMALFFTIIGTSLQELEHVPALLLLCYGLTFFFSNFGPNSTTFILPAETFPAHLRATLNGFCAAAGKLGATVGSAAFKPLAKASINGTMIACAVVSLLGAIITFFFVEDRRGKGMESMEVVVRGARPPHAHPYCSQPPAANGDQHASEVVDANSDEI